MHRADFALYASAIGALAIVVLVEGPHDHRAQIGLLIVAGLGAWTLVEYLLHRFVLHGLQPFRRWHAEHHLHQAALIGTPTVFSALLFALLMFLPALAVSGLWRACAFTLGVLIGYLAYAVTHHAVHHWRGEGAWLSRRKRWHALHHDRHRAPGHYGVTSGVWDRVFGSAAYRPAVGPRLPSN